MTEPTTDPQTALEVIARWDASRHHPDDPPCQAVLGTSVEQLRDEVWS